MGQLILWVAEAPEILFEAYGKGNFFPLPYVSTLKMLIILWRIR